MRDSWAVRGCCPAGAATVMIWWKRAAVSLELIVGAGEVGQFLTPTGLGRGHRLQLHLRRAQQGERVGGERVAFGVEAYELAGDQVGGPAEVQVGRDHEVAA
ncbi:hypothetical protein AB0M95_15660, partial [Sphaerisporangium sp. NPDC051017]|uniref:hypothetical protein n=1 Tax=Sphaerisporangium sp. NPDC051017 TaxID=3154636 RepID=UPI0034459CF7